MRRLALYLTSLACAAALASPALAGGRVMVPPLPAHAHVEPLPLSHAPTRAFSVGHAAPVRHVSASVHAGRQGCWQSYNPVYGLYRIAFCLGHRGTGAYRVNGGGYDCRGRSSWHRQGDTIVYQMHHGSCGSAADWTADMIYCRGSGRGQNLACTYAPAVKSQKPTGFSAFRQ